MNISCFLLAFVCSSVTVMSWYLATFACPLQHIWLSLNIFSYSSPLVFQHFVLISKIRCSRLALILETWAYRYVLMLVLWCDFGISQIQDQCSELQAPRVCNFKDEICNRIGQCERPHNLCFIIQELLHVLLIRKVIISSWRKLIYRIIIFEIVVYTSLLKPFSRYQHKSVTTYDRETTSIPSPSVTICNFRKRKHTIHTTR